MINSNSNLEKSANDYLEHVRQSIGHGHSDRAESRAAKKELGKDDFIKLMSTQLKYQDPTSPLKNEEMAAQLAQFSSVEQMSNVNRNLEKMSNASAARDNLMAASLIGKRVLTDGSSLRLAEGGSATMNFELPEAISRGSISVVDAKDNVVREIPLEKLEKGKQSIKWDGRDEKGTEAKAGEYSFRVTAYSASNKPVEAKISSFGIISGIEFEKGKPILLIGNDRVPMDSVSKIENADAPISDAKNGSNEAKGSPLAELKDASNIAKKPAQLAPEGRMPVPSDAGSVSGRWLDSGLNEASDNGEKSSTSTARSEPSRESLAAADKAMQIEDGHREMNASEATSSEEDYRLSSLNSPSGSQLWNPAIGGSDE